MGLNFRKYLTQFSLLFLIVLNILDLLKLLPEDFDFLKKVISWALVAHIFYDVSFTRLFFGPNHDQKSGFITNRYLDLLILLSFLSLTMKEIVVVALELEGATFFKGIIEFIKFNSTHIMNYSTYFGAISLIILSIYLATFTKVNKTSLLGNLGLYDKNIFLKLIATFLVLTTFYTLVFELLLEWLAIAVDSTLGVLGIFVIIYFTFRLHRHLSPSKLISKIGTFAEDFEEHFLNFFHDKVHFFLGISGLLVLHLLTEISNFLMPYFLKLVSSHYFTVLGHEPVYNLFFTQFAQNPLVIFGYLLNIIAILSLTIFPAVLWYEIYKNKHKTIPNSLLSVYFGSLFFFLVNPLFRFSQINYLTNLVGVDIILQPISLINLNQILLISISLMIVIFLLSRIKIIHDLVYHFTVLSVIIAFGIYLSIFYLSYSKYFMVTLNHFLQTNEILFLVFYSLFIGLKIIFVVFGFLFFFKQLFKKHLL